MGRQIYCRYLRVSSKGGFDPNGKGFAAVHQHPAGHPCGGDRIPLALVAAVVQWTMPF